MKKCIQILFICFLLTMTSGCNKADDEINDYESNAAREFMIEMGRLSSFLNFIEFDNHFGWTTFRLADQVLMLHHETNVRNEIILVQNAEVAAEFGLPYDKIIAWPSAYSLGILAALNMLEFNYELLERLNTTPEMLGLSFPLSEEDLIKNWQSIIRLVGHGLTNDDMDALRSNAGRYADETIRTRDIYRLLFPGRLDAINELLIGRYINDVQLEAIRHWLGDDLMIADLPTIPFTEEDVHYNPRLITLIIHHLIDSDNRRTIEPEAFIRRQWEQSQSLEYRG